jgi:hypothetical protein
MWWGGHCTPAAQLAAAAVQEEPVEIPDEIFHAGNRAEDIALVQGQGFEVDDNNDPAPENIPALWDEVSVAHDLYEGQSWGWVGIDRHFVAGGTYNEPLFPHNWVPQGKFFLDFFIDFFIDFFPMV